MFPIASPHAPLNFGCNVYAITLESGSGQWKCPDRRPTSSVVYTFVVADESLRLVTDMGKTDIALVSPSPLTVNTADMRVIAVPSLVYRNMDALPARMMCENNGRTGTRPRNTSRDDTIGTVRALDALDRK